MEALLSFSRNASSMKRKLAAALQTYENIRGRYASPVILVMRVTELKKRIKTGTKE